MSAAVKLGVLPDAKPAKGVVAVGTVAVFTLGLLD